ncbi:aspartyl protease [Balneicella halophila]|uniref:Aspartyl protease n=1 Tax=Balneicella halophila TaxID=1537566 RepID=A0A7L4URJ3_BALHA|nr:aspartyl protease family protein [Balneicella halophila]PVX52373.1 aspartyl protease [Balneicella halophila]
MRPFLKISIYVISFFISSQIIFAQDDYFKLSNRRKAVVIPFKFINKSIIIPLTINESDTLYFMLDTGLKNTLITELHSEDSIELNHTTKETIVGLGGAGRLSVYTSFDNTVKLKGIEGYNQRMNFIEEDIFQLSQLSGHKINGIIGYDLLKHFILKIDYSKRKLTFYNPKYYNKRLRSYSHFPMEIMAGKPYIHTDIITPNNKKEKLKLLIDTGAGLPLWLMDNNNIQISKPDTTVYSYIGQGLSGQIYGEYGRIPKLLLNNIALHNVMTAFPNADDVRGANSEGRNGTIGSEVLRRFYVILNYPKKKLSLKPNKSFKDPFYFNQSGVDFYQPDLTIPLYSVYNIRSNSPAEKAGLKVNDVIIKINKKNALKMSLQEVIRTFEKIEISKNKKVNLFINRKDSMINIEYQLPQKSL